MGHKAHVEYIEKLETVKSGLVRTIYAKYKDHKKVKVYSMNMNDKYAKIRNLDYSYLCGWSFIDPTDKYVWFDTKKVKHETYEVDKMRVCKMSCSIGGKLTQTKEQIENIILSCEKTRNFIYTFRAVFKDKDIYLWEVMDMLKMWLQYPQCELLFKLGYENLAMTKTIYRLPKDKKQRIIKYLMEHEVDKHITYTELICEMNNYNYYLFSQCMWHEKLYQYISKANAGLDIYRDYLDMCKQLDKDLKDPYWKYPTHLRERHDKVLTELNAVRDAERLLREKNGKNMAKAIIDIGSKLATPLNAEINGYKLSVASSLEDIKEQAKELSQCLVRCDYYKKYANRQCILLFIRKGNKRLATAEVFYNKKKPLGQFYADEKDRDNCIPNKKLKDTLNTWLARVYQKQNFKTLLA